MTRILSAIYSRLQLIGKRAAYLSRIRQTVEPLSNISLIPRLASHYFTAVTARWRQKSLNGFALGFDGLSASLLVKKFLRCDLSNVFQICSSTAFGLASPPVSLKLSRPDHCRERETNPRPSLSHCERSSASPAGKKPSRLGGVLSNSLTARSLGMVERLITNSELCALCRSGRAKAAVAWCRDPHPPVNDRRCGATGADGSAVGPPSSQHCQSAWRHLSASSARHAPW